jgi:hypothetical protein
MRFRYLTALYGLRPNQTHIAVPELGEERLHQMAADLVASEDLVAIYVPLGTEEDYRPGNMRGRVVGGVRLVPMPKGKSTRDYFFDDLDGSPRWPVGWPCRVVYAPAVEECPLLRSIVDAAHKPNSFQPYVSRLKRALFQVDRKVADRLDAWFTRFPVCQTVASSPS